jgi:acyl-CoA thioesterase I
MIRKILALATLLVIIFIFFEVAGLIRLKESLSSYAAFWRKYPTGGTFTYIALGDSAAQGIGASKPQLGYVGLLANQIGQSTGKTVRVVNLSVSGAKVEDVIKDQLPELKNYSPDLITVEIGSNDVVHYNAQQFQAQYTALAAALPKNTVVSNIPYFGGRVRNNIQAIEASQFISEAVARYNLRLVDLQTETRKKQSYLNYAADFFHPSNRGYQNWDEAFWKVIKPLL